MNLTLSLIGVALLVLVFGWLTGRAWRAQHPLLKWSGVTVAGLLTLLGLLAVALPLVGLYRLHRPTAPPAPDIQLAHTPAQVTRGERLAYLCVQCHSSSGALPLDGASADITEGGLGALYPTNLTPGGPLQTWTDGEIGRAIREGIHQSGRTLLLMPSHQYHVMSDDDVTALVAYLRSQPVVTRQTPPTELNLLGAAVVGVGIFPISRQPPITAPVAAPPVGPTAEYGAYLTRLSGCDACHGEGLRGGDDPFTPIGPHLPAMIGQWDAGQFISTIRSGVDPYGRTLNGELMPWPDYAKAFSDEELTAIYTYIGSLPLGPPSAE
ncbi:MAG: cytochrome c [Caldilinea sp. CFX5]|nr:cytochrome c [Caldilinea sp. CFX5]